MRTRIITALIASGLLFGSADAGLAATRRKTRSQQVKHKRRVKTAKRVGAGAAGGAAIGALAGGGKGAAIGAGAGAGAGALYDKHQKDKGKN